MAQIKQTELNIMEKDTGNISKVDMLNMKTTSKPLNELKDTIKISAMSIIHDTDEDGEPVVKGFILSDAGECYGTISPTALRGIDDAIDLIVDGYKLACKVITATSKGGRDFISLHFTQLQGE